MALSVSVLLMGYTAQGVVFTTFMIIYSLAYGGLAALQEPIRADYFGTRAFATIQGMSRSVITAGTFLGSDHCRLFLRPDEELHNCIRRIRGHELAGDSVDVSR